MVAAMRQAFILLLVLGSALSITGPIACGGNVVVDGNAGGAGIGGAGGAVTTTLSAMIGAGGLGVGGAIPPGSSTGDGVSPSCVTCAESLMVFEQGERPTLPLCTDAAATASNALIDCACGGACEISCEANACITQPASAPCLDCLPANCSAQLNACMSN